MDDDTRAFFENHYYEDAVAATRAALARRIYTMTAFYPAFRRMFTAQENGLDLYARTQDEGAIILVNTNEGILRRDGSILFGRYIIARLIAAIRERATIPRQNRRSTELIIDEASPYFDETFDYLLTGVAQFGLKATVAFQHFDQLSDKIKSAISGQTSVKYLGGLSYDDARKMANEVRCETEFLQNLKTDISDPPQWSEFAVYADNFTSHPMKLRLPFYTLERQPMMTEQEHASLLERNKQCVAPDISPAAPQPSPQPASLQTIVVENEDHDPGEPSAQWGKV
jgi:hypothetical protein